MNRGRLSWSVRAYLSKVIGLSMVQTARLVRMYKGAGSLQLKPL